MAHAVIDVDALRADLTNRVVARDLRWFDEIDSTNAYVLGVAASAPDGLTVVAELQTAGRGRLHRPWHAPRGAAILFSTLLRLNPESAAARRMPLWTALAVQDGIQRASHLRTTIKWPNDLLADGRKLAGILIESTPLVGLQRAYVVGIGINCLQHRRHFPEEIRAQATSLDLVCADPIDRQCVARAVLGCLDDWLHRVADLPAEDLKALWFERSAGFGDRVRLTSAGRTQWGRVIDLDPDAGILVELEAGGRQLFDPSTTSCQFSP